MTHTLDLLTLLHLVTGQDLPSTSGPKPSPLLEQVRAEDVDQQRSFACSEYDACLDVAVRRGWRSWTCRRCALFLLAPQFQAAAATHEAEQRPFA